MPNFATTTRFGFRVPVIGGAGNKVSDFAAIVAALGSDIDTRMLGWSSGTLENLPPPGTPGRTYETTDGNGWFLDSGSAWTSITTGVSWGVISTGNAGPLIAGSGDWSAGAYSPGTRVSFNTARAAGRMVALATPVALNGVPGNYTAAVNIANTDQIVVYAHDGAGNPALNIGVAFVVFG